MMTLTLIRHPASGDGSYRSTIEGEWLPGETREVSDDRAAELLTDFPGAFRYAGPVAIHPREEVINGSSLSARLAAIDDKANRDDPNWQEAVRILAQPVRSIAGHLRKGTPLYVRDWMIVLERKGKRRKTVLAMLGEEG